MTCALIVVDVQREYFAGGKMPLDNIESISDNCQDLLNHFRKKKAPTFIIQHIAPVGATPILNEGTPGIEIHEKVRPTSQDKVIVKQAANSFLGTDLKESLDTAGVSDLVICGAMGNMCIDATTRAAADFGYACTVAHDACASCALEFNGAGVSAENVHNAFMAALAFGYAKPSLTADILAEQE